MGEGDRWEDIIRVNLTGTYNTLMASRPFLDRSEGVKQVLVTSSVLARFGVPGQSAYVTSKTGLLGLVRSLAVEWSPQGIMVNALCPGWVDTDMARNSIQSMADAQGMSFEDCKAQQEAILPSLADDHPSGNGAMGGFRVLWTWARGKMSRGWRRSRDKLWTSTVALGWVESGLSVYL